MKRVGYLMPRIAEWNNLLLAYYKAKKGKSHKKEVMAYGKNLKTNLKYLQSQILKGQLVVGDYHYFTIYDPKKRQICAASFPERILHHAIMNVCHEHFEKFQISDSYATRIGKGTFRALDKAFSLQKEYKYFLKMDIRKYFDSIDHNILYHQLERRFKDADLLLLFKRILKSYETQKGKGVPIGNLTSQYFANHYLAFADHFIKQELKAKAYVRYMDDFVVWHNDHKYLQKVQQQIKHYLTDRLALTLKISYLNKTTHGLPFLGFRLYPNKVLLARRSKVRFRKKISKIHVDWENAEISEVQAQQQATALFSFIEKSYTKKFRKQYL
ncbi:MAG: RNA-directed DNA polymerase [Bernardetiaceae bacterium]|nr:RNA-directed DNA polymerase [Bernardetiaceae bacterium]